MKKNKLNKIYSKLIFILLSLFSTYAHGATLSLRQVDIKTIENLGSVDKDNLLSNDCFPCEIMEVNLKEKLSEEEIVKISNDEGAVLQYLIFKDDLKESGIDTKQLSLNINKEIKKYKLFFKNNNEYKGGFIFLYTIIPIISGEPQVKDIKERNKDLYNEIINKIECRDNYCSSELVIEVSFTDIKQYPNMLLKLRENSVKEENINPVIIKNLEIKKPINVYLLMGTNGFSISPLLKEDFIKGLDDASLH